MALWSKGITLIVAANGSSTEATSAINTLNALAENNDGSIPGLMEVGEISAVAEGGSYDQIEVTTLADSKHMYINGLRADTTSGAEVTMKFLYEKNVFSAFKEVADGLAVDDATAKWTITIPQGNSFEIVGSISNLVMDSATTNNALTFTVNILVESITVK